VIFASIDAWLCTRLGRRAGAVLLAALAAAAFVAGLNAGPDPLLFHHFALARSILSDGFSRVADPLLLGAQAPPGGFPYWLASVTLLGAETIGGRGGVLMVGGAAFAVAVAAAWLAADDGEGTARHDVALALPALLVLLGALRGFAGPRPASLGCALLGVTLLAARRWAEGRGREILLFPAAALLWANVDASLALGVAVLVAHAAEAGWRAWRARDAAAARRAGVLGGLALAGLIAPLASPWPESGLAGGRALGVEVAAAAARGVSRDLAPASIALALLAAAAALHAARGGRVALAALAGLGVLVLVAGTPHAPLGAVLAAPTILSGARRLRREAAAPLRLALAGSALALSAAGAIAWTPPPGVVLGLSGDLQAEPDLLLAKLQVPGLRGVVYATPRLGDYAAWRLGVKVPFDVRPDDGAPPVLDEPLRPEALGRYDALLLAYAPDGDLRPAGACGPPFEIPRSAFALVAFDDAATLWVRRDGAYGSLAAAELRTLDPCAEPSPVLLGNPGWREAFLADADRAYHAVQSCEVCFAARGVAEAASGGVSPPVFDGPHPVLRRLRDAARLVAEARAAEGNALAAKGDVLGANAAFWRSILTHDNAAGRCGLALELAALGESAAAAQHARRALELDPASAQAQLAFRLLASGRGGGVTAAAPPARSPR
jgi:hypothetical protein